MTDQWYFEIGDGQTYGPFPLEKLHKWAAAGNLMPTHRVRRADSTEWTIAAYVPGLELTTADTAAGRRRRRRRRRSRGKLGALVAALTRKERRGKGKRSSIREPDIVALCDELMEIAFERERVRHPHRSGREHHPRSSSASTACWKRCESCPSRIHSAAHQPLQGARRKMDIAERRMAQDGRFFQCLGPEQRRDPHSRRDAAHDARRADHAAAAGRRNRAAHAQPARHVGGGAADVRRRTPARSRA